jgi:hypothetical protein
MNTFSGRHEYFVIFFKVIIDHLSIKTYDYSIKVP